MRRFPTIFFVCVVCSVSFASAATLSINANLINTGAFSITGSVSKGSGSFVIDHPLDPKNKLLYHSFVESPDMKNVYAGTARLDASGEAVVALPDYFDALNKEYRYQLFPMGEPMPDLYISRRIEGNAFAVGGGAPGGKISWMVTGIRRDPYALAYPIIVEVKKGPDALLEKGECVFKPLCE